MRQVRVDHGGADSGAREELLRQASLARAFDVDVGEIGAAEVKAMYPHLEVGDVTGCASARSTASAIRPTSPWRWPRAHGSAARGSSRA
jgi:hypothetical protein